MRKHLLAGAVLVILLIVGGVAIARLTAGEDARTFNVRRDQDQGPSSPVITLTNADLEAFPPEAQEGWRDALDNGIAQFTLPAKAAEAYADHLQTLANRDGATTTWRYFWGNTYFSQSERLH